MSFEEKYLKYKKKYFILQNQIAGYDFKAFLKNIIDNRTNSILSNINSEKTDLAILLYGSIITNNGDMNNLWFTMEFNDISNYTKYKVYLTKFGIVHNFNEDPITSKYFVLIYRDEYIKLLKLFDVSMNNLRIENNPADPFHPILKYDKTTLSPTYSSADIFVKPSVVSPRIVSYSPRVVPILSSDSYVAPFVPLIVNGSPRHHMYYRR